MTDILDSVLRVPDASARQALLESVRRSGAAHATPGADAARSQDFLCGPDGLPE